MNSPNRPATSIQLAKNANTLAGESFSFSTIPGTHYNDVELLLQNTLHRNCDAVRKLATPCDPTVSTMACKLTENIDADLEDTKAKRASIYPAGYWDYKAFAHAECGMFPLSSGVERQVAPAPHAIVANVEIAADSNGLDKAVQLLTAITTELFAGQHNRRFAWELTTSSRTIHAYIFGPDDIWSSTEMDITSAEGRLAFISLLVDWSLCSVDGLGLDPTIRYVIDGSVGDPHLEIDVHEMDESTSQMEKRTYYSKRRVGAADRLFRCHARYLAASTSRETLDTPKFLVKDMWTTSNSDPAGDSCENSVYAALQSMLDSSSKCTGGFSQFASTGLVYLSQGDSFVADSTVTAFVGLPDTTHVCQHRRTVLQWAGNSISAADNPSQVVISIADAMTALNAAYVKCKILHGNISDRAILFRETAATVKGVLAGLDYAPHADDSTVKAPELSVFQSIRILEHLAEPGTRCVRSREYGQAPNTRLDDWESMFYVICML
ncbi:hypothetical protein GGI19_005584, partial [Coemansia pectinata]